MGVDLKNWLDRYTLEEREFLVQEMFAVFDRAKIETLTDIKLSNIGKKIDRACFTIVYLDKNKNILDIETTTEFDIGKYLGGSIRGYGVWDEINRRYVEYDSYEIILDYAGNYDN